MYGSKIQIPGPKISIGHFDREQDDFLQQLPSGEALHPPDLALTAPPAGRSLISADQWPIAANQRANHGQQKYMWTDIFPRVYF